jgi:RNA methyltransferase, TrmH family
LARNSVGVAIVHQKPKPERLSHENEVLTLILDGISDPGNLGTIIRTAEWYGIKNIYCSENTAEFYNPKVISSTKGSFCRVNLHYLNLSEFIKEINKPILGAFLEGKNVREIKPSEPMALIVGSESFGISSELSKYVSQKITIPRIGSAESLNAAVACGIILDRLV